MGYYVCVTFFIAAAPEAVLEVSQSPPWFNSGSVPETFQYKAVNIYPGALTLSFEYYIILSLTVWYW